MSEGVNTEAVSASLRSIKLLRCNVKDLFRVLAESSQLPPNSGSSPNGATADFKEDQEKNFLCELQGMMTHINQRIRELETSCTLICHPNASANVHLGNQSDLDLV
jgi:hypothetical protein